MNVKLYDKDWAEKLAESRREVVITTPVSEVRITEKNGVLQVTSNGAVSR